MKNAAELGRLWDRLKSSKPSDRIVVKEYRSIIDFVLFNLCWIANAVSGLYSLPYVGPLVVLLAVTIHLYLVDDTWAELLFLVVVSVIGYLWDTLNFRLGVIGFPTVTTTNLVPVWLLAQWVAFGLLFRHSIRWLRDRYILAGLLGATGGPLSYYSATRMDILSFGSPLWQTLLILAVGWAIIVPVFGHVSRRYENVSFGHS